MNKEKNAPWWLTWSITFLAPGIMILPNLITLGADHKISFWYGSATFLQTSVGAFVARKSNRAIKYKMNKPDTSQGDIDGTDT